MEIKVKKEEDFMRTNFKQNLILSSSSVNTRKIHGYTDYVANDNKFNIAQTANITIHSTQKWKKSTHLS